MADEKTVSKGNGGAVTVERVKALVEARVEAAIEEGASRPEIAEPEGWWNLWAYGPFQVTGVGGPLRPHSVIKTGERFYVATVMWLNPGYILPPGISVCDLISNLACDFVLDYCTGDMCAWTASQPYSRRGVEQRMIPDRCWYVDVQEFTALAGTESCYEMNICGKITGCEDTGGAPPLAGYVTAVYDFDADLFYPPAGPPGRPPGWRYDTPVRFYIY